MKRILGLILVLMLTVCLLVPTAAFAEPDPPVDPPTESPTQAPTEAPTQAPQPQKAPEVSVKASPSELLAAGSVSLEITVKNPNNTDMSNVAIAVDGSTVKTVNVIAAGATYTYSGKYSVKDSKIGTKIPVKVSYPGGSATDNFVIGQKEANIKVNTITKVNKTSAIAGGKVDFSFSIENNSDIKIENVSLKASTLNDGKTLGKTFSLDAGKATILLYTATITQTIDVSPILTFKAAGKEYTKNLDTLTITMNEADMTITASASKVVAEPGEEIVFDLLLTNNGNVDFTNISLYDANDKRIVTSSNTLNAGGTLSVQHTMTFEESGSYDFYVLASDADGTSYNFRSNLVEMEIQEAAPTDFSEYFTIEASYTPEYLEKPGEVVFTVTLKNTFDGRFTDVSVKDAATGNVIEQYAVFDAGEKEFSFKSEINETTSMDFVLTATDPEGNPFEAHAVTPAIRVETVKNSSSRLSTLLIVLIVVILLIVGCGVTLVILIVRSKKKSAAEEQRKAAAVSSTRQAARAAQNPPPRRRPAPQQPAPARPKPAPAAPQKTELPEDPVDEVFPEEEVELPKAPRRSYETLMAEPESPTVPEAPLPEEDLPELQPLPKRHRRSFEDRNNF